MASTSPTVEAVRSLEFYYGDGNVVFEVCAPSPLNCQDLITSRHLQVSNVLYQLHKSILTLRLDLFGGIFLLPNGRSQPGNDGLDNGSPIQIQDGVAVWEDFKALLRHIYGG